jgi:MFS family permease
VARGNHERVKQRIHPAGQQHPPMPLSWLSSRLHYGWVIVILGVLVVMCAIGIGRFAFGMLLPSMGEGLALSYREMGVISTSNFIGYLIGALVCGRLIARFGARRLIAAALTTIWVSLMIISISSGFWLVLVLFTVTGLGSGSANVAIMGLISYWFQRSLRGRASGLVVSGSGFAIMLTGLIIPVINSVYGPTGWRVGWFVLALLVVLVAVATGLLLRNYPQDVGLAPAGHAVIDAHPHAPIPAAEQRRATWQLGMIYFAFGFSYVIYATFIVTTLVQERGFSESTAGWLWFAFGFLSIFSGAIFGALSDRTSRRLGFAAVFAMHTVAFVLLGIPQAAPFLYVSVILFGLSAWSIPGIMGATVGDYMGPRQAVRSLGILTGFVGIGQAAGPVVAGVLADWSASFDSSYLLAAVFAVLGVILSLTLRPPSSGQRVA